MAYAKGQSNSGCSVPWTDARVSMQYDTLGRLITTNFRDTTTPDIHRTYDANGNIKTVQRGGVNWSYAYNDADLITSENLDIDGRHYDLSYSYDSLGRMVSQYLPAAGVARQQLQYQYDSLDRATRVRAVKSGQSSVTLAHSISYHPDGQVRRFTYGNGYVYNKTLNARLQPSRVWNEKGSAKAFDRSYAYDKRGLVTSIDDGVNDAYSLELGYGPLGRLSSASGIWGTGSFYYDATGNLFSKRLGDRTVKMSYDSKNRLSSYTDTGPGGSKSLAYDARGNVTALGDLNFKYDYSDQPVQVSGQASGQYRYDGNLKRVKSVINGKSIYNIYNLAGQLVHVDEVSDNTRTDYVGGGGMSIARIQNNRITYLHNDHLGSTAAATDASGRLLWTQHHTPFGESWNQVAANDDQAGYTGHIKDSATGLMYMQARYYDPVIGRFLSNDPVSFTAPYNFNRYAYAANNPYTFIDPDGKNCTASVVGVECSNESSLGHGPSLNSDLGRSEAKEARARKIDAQKGNDLVNPTGQGIRGCDSQGCGEFGARRGNRKHLGSDFISTPGQDVKAISDGKIIRLPSGKYDGIVVGDGKGTSWKILYVDVSSSLSIGDAVTAGQTVGTAQDITSIYEGITNHVHVKLRVDSKVVDPAQHIPITGN